MSFGANLKRERELRGVSLEEISKATKISVRLLAAIELDRYDLLPRGIFRKSFIKSYAKYIGLNAEKLLQEYSFAVEGPSPPPASEERFKLGRPVATAHNRNLKITIGIIIVILLVAASFWYFNSSKASSHSKVNKASIAAAALGSTTPQEIASSSRLNVNPTIATDPVPSPHQTTPTTTSSSKSSQLKVLGELATKGDTTSAAIKNPVDGRSNTGPLNLDIAATEKSWLYVSAGETTLYSGILQPAQSKKFSLEKALKLTLGNAGGIKLSVNGKPFVSVGKSGEVRVLEVSPKNYQQFLAPAP